VSDTVLENLAKNFSSQEPAEYQRGVHMLEVRG